MVICASAHTATRLRTGPATAGRTSSPEHWAIREANGRGAFSICASAHDSWALQGNAREVFGEGCAHSMPAIGLPVSKTELQSENHERRIRELEKLVAELQGQLRLHQANDRARDNLRYSPGTQDPYPAGW